LVKFGNRLNAAVLGRDGEKEARSASATAEILIRDDQEGWVISEYGKGWTNVCLTELAVCALTYKERGSGLMDRTMGARYIVYRYWKT
jgi:hypothetical protein